MHGNLKTKMTSGIFWNGTSQFSTQLFQFIVVIILARLLSPKDFGIVGLTTIFIGLVAAINELGLSAAIIQKRDVNELHLATTFWSNVIFGIILFISIIFISPFIAAFFQEDIIKPILIVSSISLLIGPLSITHRAMLEKNLEFKNIMIIEIFAAIISGSISILLAISGFGVWSLVFGSLSGSIVSVIVLWKINTWRPKLRFSLYHFKELFVFGSNVTGSKILGYMVMRVDYLIVGKFFGTAILGYYTLARTLTSFPVQKISWTIMRVTFPAFSSIQKNNEMLKKGYLKVTKYISLIAFPMLAGLFIVGPEFVYVIYGEKWSPMIILLQIFCIGGALSSIGSVGSTIQYSKGRSDLQFKWQIYAAAAMFIASMIGINFGIVGMAIIVTIVSAIFVFLFQIVTNELIDLKMSTYIKETIPATICSIILIIGVEIYKRAIFVGDINLIYILLSSIFIGMIVYVIIMRIFYNHVFDEIKKLIYETRG